MNDVLVTAQPYQWAGARSCLVEVLNRCLGVCTSTAYKWGEWETETSNTLHVVGWYEV